MKEVKCEHCGLWTDGNLDKCTSCDGIHNERQIKEKEVLSQMKPAEIPLIKIHPNDHWFLKIFKSIFRFVKIMFLVIISVLAYMSSSLAHG